ncbi:MAG: prenyltransferase/squalene oxidase repeat-containing protein [Candidatus Anstonellales archaeon]
MEINSIINGDKLYSFIIGRLNSDGGYTFAKKLYSYEFPSSISETYYALETLHQCNFEILNRDKTIEYLESNISLDSFNVTHVYFIIKSLEILGKKINLIDKISYLVTKKIFNTLEEIEDHRWLDYSTSYDTSESKFSTLYYAIKLRSFLNLKDEHQNIIFKRLNDVLSLKFKRNELDIVSFYHIISALFELNPKFYIDNKMCEFILNAQVNTGGFSLTAFSMPAFIESTYMAIDLLKKFNKEVPNKRGHLEFISKLQNIDGGFRRSSETGISTLLNSYYAILSIKLLI